MRPKNRLRSILCLILCLLGLTSTMGCWGIEPSDQSYVLIVGIDRGETNLLRISYLIAKTPAIGGGGGQSQGGGGSEESGLVVTVEAPSFYAAMNLANSFVSRRITMLHLKGIIFSEAMARDGSMAKFMATMPAYRELRRDAFIAVAKDKPEKVVSSIKPMLALNPSKYVEELTLSSRFTGISPHVQVIDFYTQLGIQGYHPVTNLISTSDEKLPPESKTANGKWHSEGDYLAGNIVKKGDLPFEAAGTAVFRNDKMVGELNIEETRLYNMFHNTFEKGVYSMPDPINSKEILSMMISQSRKPRIKVTMTDQGPVIDAEIYLDGEVLGDTSLIDYGRPANKAVLEQAFSLLMENRVKALVRHSQELDTDFLGFGLHARHLALSQKEWQQLDWDSQYRRAKVNVGIDFKIRRTGLLYRTMPITNPEKGVEEGENQR